MNIIDGFDCVFDFANVIDNIGRGNYLFRQVLLESFPDQDPIRETTMMGNYKFIYGITISECDFHKDETEETEWCAQCFGAMLDDEIYDILQIPESMELFFCDFAGTPDDELTVIIGNLIHETYAPQYTGYCHIPDVSDEVKQRVDERMKPWCGKMKFEYDPKYLLWSDSES